MQEFDLKKVNDGERVGLKCGTCLHLGRTRMVAGASVGFNVSVSKTSV